MIDLDPSLGIHDLIMVFRTLVLYGVSFIVVRLMGKRSLGQLSPFDFLIIIIIGSAIATPMEDESIPLVHGLIPIITIVGVNYFLYWIIRKNRRIEDFLQGKPTILIENGKVILQNLKKERITLADFMILLRGAGVKEIDEIEEAVMEPNGKLSLVYSEASLIRKFLSREKKDDDRIIERVQKISRENDLDLNLILDGLALGLDDSDISDIAETSLQPVTEIRKILKIDQKGMGLNLGEKQKFMKKE